MLAPTLATTDMSVDLRTTIGSPRRSSVVVLVRPWVLVSIPMPLSGLGEAPGALDGPGLRWGREQNGNALAGRARVLRTGVERRQCSTTSRWGDCEQQVL
jgi:hypothetical protein